MSTAPEVIDNSTQSRFELQVGEWTAIAEYRVVENALVLTHTEVPDALQGQGVGSRLARGVLGIARLREQEVVPLCEFMAAYIRSHPEYLDLVSTTNRARLGLEPAE